MPTIAPEFIPMHLRGGTAIDFARKPVADAPLPTTSRRNKIEHDAKITKDSVESGLDKENAKRMPNS